MEIARYITCISHLVGVSLTVNSTERAEEGSTDKAVKIKKSSGTKGIIITIIHVHFYLEVSSTVSIVQACQKMVVVIEH